MRKLRSTFVAAIVVVLLTSIHGAATAGVLWFQTAQLEVANRTGAGVLTVPFDRSGLANLVVWTPRRVLVSGIFGVTELKFQGASIEDTLGVLALPPFGDLGAEQVTLNLVIWTPKRVLLAALADFGELTSEEPSLWSVIELMFQGASIEDTLGVVLFVSGGEPSRGLVIWTQSRVLVTGPGPDLTTELTFQGRSIRNTLGVATVFFPMAEESEEPGPTTLFVIWNARRVLLASPGISAAEELTFQGGSIEHTLGVLSLPATGNGEGEAGGSRGIVIWTTERVLTFSGEGESELTFNGNSIRSNVRVAGQAFRRQADSLLTSVHETAAAFRGNPGTILRSEAVIELFFGPF